MEFHKLYNGEIELGFDDAKHLYTVGDKKVPGVTGVVGCIAKPPLIWWAADEASKFWVELMTGGVFSAKDKKTIRVKDGALPPTPILDELTIEEFYQGGRFAHHKKKTQAADIGTLGHKWIELYIKGENPETPINPQVKAIVDALLDWEKSNKVKFLQSEIKIYSKKYNYAGTMDFEAEVNGKLVVGDIKTSSGIYEEMRFQVSAYRQARQEETGQTYDHQLIIRLGKFPKEDGTPDFEVKEFNDFDKDFKGFLGALLLDNRLRELKNEEIQCKSQAQ